MHPPRGPFQRRNPLRPAFILVWFLFPCLTSCNAPANQSASSTPGVSRGDDRERDRDRQPRNGSYPQTGDFRPDEGYSHEDNRRHRRGHHTGRGNEGGGYSPHASTPGSFDFYLLNLSWAPEYCHAHPQATECTNHSTFVLHGLWPQNSDGSYPDHCSDAPGPISPGQYNGLYPDTGLLQHEWQAHGTCTGLTPEVYLATAQRAVRAVTIPPALAHLNASADMPPDELLHLFTKSNPGLPAGSLALSCGNNYLTAVEVCLDRNLHPAVCQGIRSCRADTVRIPAP